MLHEEYGDVVRVLPNKLSFRNAAAWRDIYHPRSRHQFVSKDPDSLAPGDENVYNIITVINQEDHARYRGTLSQAFSATALREQEPMVMHYVDLLIERLRQRCKDGPQDMVKWATLIYFDIIADLTFGESLRGLEDGEYHPWLEGLFGSTMRLTTYRRALRRLPFASLLDRILTPRRLIDQQVKHAAFVRERVQRRMNSPTDRRDFMSHILPYDEKTARMSMPEVRATFGALMLAGSENVATTLIFTVFLILKHPKVLAQLVEEVQSSTTEGQALDFTTVNSFKYLTAVVKEAMRLRPAAPTSQPRVAPAGGMMVAGHEVPGGVRTAFSLSYVYLLTQSSDLCRLESPSLLTA